MTQIESSHDYAVEVPGLGFVTAQFPAIAVSYCDTDDTALYVGDRDEIASLARNVVAQYHRLAMHDIARTVRIVQRTVTVTRGEWEPADLALSAKEGQ